MRESATPIAAGVLAGDAGIVGERWSACNRLSAQQGETDGVEVEVRGDTVVVAVSLRYAIGISG